MGKGLLGGRSSDILMEIVIPRRLWPPDFFITEFFGVKVTP